MQLYKTMFEMKSESATTSILLKGETSDGVCKAFIIGFINWFHVRNQESIYTSVSNIKISNTFFWSVVIRTVSMAAMPIVITYLFSINL